MQTLSEAPVARDYAAARRAVEAEMGRRRWDMQRLAAETRLDPGTIGDFLSGQRRPRLPTIGAIEDAFGWPSGRLLEIADGVPSETVGPDPEDEDSFVFRRPPGMSDREWAAFRRGKAAEMDAMFEEYGDD